MPSNPANPKLEGLGRDSIPNPLTCLLSGQSMAIAIPCSFRDNSTVWTRLNLASLW